MNILLFDKDHNFLDAAWEQIDGGEQIGATPADHDYMSKEVTVKEAGFAYVFVSNENPTLVEFYVDDVTVTHTPTQVIQYNEYYPFGLQASTSWTRENNTNNYLYNSGSELNKTSGWYETFFRGYDAALGRFLQVDPMSASEMATYQYAGNNPVMFNDPWGAQKKNLEPQGDMSGQRGQHIAFPDMYFNGYQDMGYDAYLSGGGGGFGNSVNATRLSTGEHWSSEQASAVTDYFLLSNRAFSQRYGVSSTDVHFKNGGWGYNVAYSAIVDVELTDAEKALGYATYEWVVDQKWVKLERKETQGGISEDQLRQLANKFFGWPSALNNIYIGAPPGSKIIDGWIDGIARGQTVKASGKDNAYDIYIAPNSLKTIATIFKVLGHEHVHVHDWARFGNSLNLSNSEYNAYSWEIASYLADGNKKDAETFRIYRDANFNPNVDYGFKQYNIPSVPKF